VRLTTSSQVGNEVLGYVVCRFRVEASKQSLDEAPYINCPKLSQASKHHLQSFVSPLQERLNLGFLTEGKLAAIFIKTFSWGFQLAGHLLQANNIGTIINSAPSRVNSPPTPIFMVVEIFVSTRIPEKKTQISVIDHYSLKASKILYP
jgi:hypothetical protein